jgi:hypothetical protein
MQSAQCFIFHIAVRALLHYLKRGKVRSCYVKLLLSLPLLDNPAPLTYQKYTVDCFVWLWLSATVPCIVS